MKHFDFEGLFIYDLANNHQGDLKHGLNIIKAMGDVTGNNHVKAALKFQFRQLDSFIHPEFKTRKDVKHIPRFMETALNKKEYLTLTRAVKDSGMYTISTPFDEASVDLIQELDIPLIKVASCSALDRPLLEYIAQAKKPVVASTAGLSIVNIDRLVNLLESRGVHFALMHCVALYPTPPEKLNLNQIDILKDRFPRIPIGFSTHEDPDNFDAIRIAYAKGARLFERHVGLETKKHKLNTYSSKPKEIDKWIEAYKEAVATCGGEFREPAGTTEIESLRTLMRGVYAKNEIKANTAVSRNDVYFAMPLQEEQLRSGSWVDGMITQKAYSHNDPIEQQLAVYKLPDSEIIYRIMLQVKGMLSEARIFISPESSIELSHHYGLDRFREFGAVIITCINRKYCKKLIIQLSRQKHPYHFHKEKEETFQLLFGDLVVEIEGSRKQMALGETLLVNPGVWHKFQTQHGAIFEEVSTTHINNDSYYEDEQIATVRREKRKTPINTELITRC